MRKVRLSTIYSAIAISMAICFSTQSSYAIDCAVSTPNLSDPAGALRTGDHYGWFGSEKLAAMIPQDGHWKGMGVERGYRNKSWWWYKGYKAKSGTANKLQITALNLNNGREITLSSASNAYQASDDYSWDSMSTAFEFPEAGCWQVTGIYRTEKLSIYLRVGE